MNLFVGVINLEKNILLIKLSSLYCFDKFYLNHFMKIIFKLFFILLISYSCSYTNYKPINSVGEEQLSFSQITAKEDAVSDPLIFRSEKLKWYVPNVINLSPSNKYISFIEKSNVYHNLIIKDLESDENISISGFLNVYDACFGNNDSIIFYSATESNTPLLPKRNNRAKDASQLLADKVIEYDDDGNETTSFYGTNNVYKYPNVDVYRNSIFKHNSEETIVASDYLDINVNIYDSLIFFANGMLDDFVTFTINQNSKKIKELFDGLGSCMDQNGENIYFTKLFSDKGGEIWRYNVKEDSSYLVLTNEFIAFSSPQISNDGKKLVVVGATPIVKDQNLNLDLYLFDLATEEVKQLTTHLGHDLSPCWSNDDQSIYFLSQRGSVVGNFNIWKLSF